MLLLGLGLFLAVPSLAVKSQEVKVKEARDRLDSVDAFFVKNVKTVDTLLVSNQEEMEERIGKSIGFLEKMQADRSALKPILDAELSQIFMMVDGWLNRCKTFKDDLADRSKDFNKTKREWNDFIRSAWNGGLEKLVSFVQTTTSGAGVLSLSLLLLPAILLAY